MIAWCSGRPRALLLTGEAAEAGAEAGSGGASGGGRGSVLRGLRGLGGPQKAGNYSDDISGMSRMARVTQVNVCGGRNAPCTMHLYGLVLYSYVVRSAAYV